MPADDKTIYLDYAATAPFDTRLADTLSAAPTANASSLHAPGRNAARALEDSRRRIARALGAKTPNDIIFTSGGTESDCTAIWGLVPTKPRDGKSLIVISAIEHHAVEAAVSRLKEHGYHVATVPSTRQGIITPDALASVIDRHAAEGEKTALVSIQAVNNEVGSIQPVKELAELAHDRGAVFVCDAVQALGKIDIDLSDWDVDAAAFSAHKIGAPKGFGLLYIKRGLRCTPLLVGGGQESGMRSGTSNVPAACVLAEAIELACEERDTTAQRLTQLRQRVIDALPTLDARHEMYPTLDDSAPHVPQVLSLIGKGLEGETLVMRLDDEGIAASSGSACSTGSLDPSPVIVALGIARQEAFGALRLSFGHATTDEDIDRLLEVLPEVLR